jgi:MFS family permease
VTPYEKQSVGRIIVKLLKKPSYLFAVYAMTNLKFIVTALQYWVPHYMKVVLGAEENTVFFLVAGSVISATTIGALSGGIITTKFLGSYTNRRSIFLCLVMLVILSASCLPLSFMRNEFAFIGCVWVVMFCHGFIEPIFTGILLNSVGPEEGATASSVLIFMQMILGFLPAPYIYGLLVDKYPVIEGKEGDNVSPWGMRGISFYSVFGVVALFLSIICRRGASGEGPAASQGNGELSIGIVSFS